MPIEVGATIPSLNVIKITEDGPAEISTGALFDGRKVVLFGLPGAFTPTCSLNHLPGFIENRDTILAKGVDEIVCLSVNDHHVMKAWAQATGGLGKITFIADWDAALTEAVGMDADLSAGGLGLRSIRYSMIVEDGKVTAVNLEEKRGEATTSGAAAMLEQLG
ncbi:peroxiredoxin [Oricola sp.]|uniref:peroxiredoxin n=1 Tax=Oricola sp. TaxID=1979950 RepID=UPI0025CDE459|nr:peroxiredoxin [Oricola sp.]MCI5076780.1 peroxiredoxin [Oricola sp.]